MRRPSNTTLALALAAAIVSPSALGAEWAAQSGADLLKICSGNDKSVENFALDFYAAGIADAITALEKYNRLPRRVCLPYGTKLKEIEGIVCAYILTHPEQGQLSGYFVVADALERAYPCH